MTRSERVQLIRAISKRLAKESGTVLDLTLRQFGASIAFYAGLEDRALHSLESVPDSALVELAEHVGISNLPIADPQGTDCWQPDSFRLFLTHVATDKAFVTELQQSLLVYHISGFVAHIDIEPTKEWESEIEKALRTADALAALLTTTFHSSKWTDQEVGCAVGRGLLVVPIRAGLDPYGFIGKYQAVQGTDRSPTDVAKDLFKSLATHPLTRNQLAEVIVKALENTWSWEGCRKDMSLLEEFPFLDAGHVSRIESAVTANEKVKDTYTVPARVAKLVARHRDGIVVS